MIPLENATVIWTEQEIEVRDALIREIPVIIREAWQTLNSAVCMRRVETPCLCSQASFRSHLDEGFPIMEIHNTQRVLRPETTAGTVEAFNLLYPMESQRNRAMPLCIWQAGKSFRDEENKDSMRVSKLRLREFYQIEFQLFVNHGTKANYIERALVSLIGRYGGSFRVLPPEETPHYSVVTRDWEIDGVEICSCSIRKDFPEGELHEVSIGLDRLVRAILA